MLPEHYHIKNLTLLAANGSGLARKNGRKFHRCICGLPRYLGGGSAIHNER